MNSNMITSKNVYKIEQSMLDLTILPLEFIARTILFTLDWHLSLFYFWFELHTVLLTLYLQPQKICFTNVLTY